MSIKDGGPFPLTFADVMGQQRDHMEEVNRLRREELRDHFAGLAMQAIIHDTQLGFDAICAEAYQYADAMLAAREQRT